VSFSSCETLAFWHPVFAYSRVIYLVTLQLGVYDNYEKMSFVIKRNNLKTQSPGTFFAPVHSAVISI